MVSRPSFRPRRLEEATRAYQAFIDKGFPVTFEGTGETLQCASDTDRANWLIFLGVCQEAIKADAGDQPIPIALRCTSNRSYVVTFSEAVALIEAMRTWGLSAQANLWRLKDLIGAAETGDALNAIDVTEGWPDA